MATVHDIRPFQTARRYGPNVYRAIVQRIVEDQKWGLSGYTPLHEAFEERRRTPPPKGAA